MWRGFVCLWRRSLDSQVFQDEGLWKLWCWCLMKASHQNYWAKVKVGKAYTEVAVNPGQFVFGRKSAAQVLNMKATTVWHRMKKLECMGNVDIDSNTHYSVVTICNWKRYQVIRKRSGQAMLTAVGQPYDTYNNNNHTNHNNNNKGKKRKTTKTIYPVDLVVEEEE